MPVVDDINHKSGSISKYNHKNVAFVDKMGCDHRLTQIYRSVDRSATYIENVNRIQGASLDNRQSWVRTEGYLLSE